MKVLVADNIAKEGVDLLKEHFEVDVKLKLKPEELISIIGDYDALAVRSDTKATAQVIEAGKKLKIIARAGVGIDNVDVEAATKKGIQVVNTPLGNVLAAAEHTIALILAEARHLPQAYASLKSGRWERSKFVGVELKNKTLGIVGLGKVGSEVARRACSFQMQLLAYDSFVSAEYASNLGVKLTTLEELLQTSDFVTLHLALTPKTKEIIGAKELAMMKPSAHLINVARGGLVDEEALYKAVEEGKIAGAAVDVFSSEPAVDNILVKSDKIVVTPHLGASTAEAQIGVGVDAAEQIVAVLHGQPAKYPINTPAK